MLLKISFPLTKKFNLNSTLFPLSSVVDNLLNLLLFPIKINALISTDYLAVNVTVKLNEIVNRFTATIGYIKNP